MQENHLTISQSELAALTARVQPIAYARIDAMTKEDKARVDNVCAMALTRLPDSWQLVLRTEDGIQCISRYGLRVIMSGCVEDDGKLWMHLSLSRDRLVPNWEQMVRVKNLFLGESALAVQVFPRSSNYVNIHKFVLHLWCCLDGDPVPDFTSGTGSI